MSAIWVPVVGTISGTIILVVYFILNSKNKADIQQTIRDALDKGSELTPELIEKMNISRSPKVADLRRGIVLIALAIATLLAGWMSGDFDVAGPIGMFPLLLGAGFLTVWKINKYE